MGEGLIVSLDEFAELVGVSSETMRVHLREAAREGAPGWLIERGDRGRAYRIEAEGAVKWWQEKRDADESANAERQMQLKQLRFETIGDAVEKPEMLALSGRQRREEYAASLEAIRYRRTLGELVERDRLTAVLSAVAIEHRRRLQQVAPEFAIAAGLDVEQQTVLARMIERAIDAFVTAIEAPDAFAG